MIFDRFLASERGNFGMMFALVAPVFLGAIGLAVDITTLASARSHMQSALDAAVLAASRLDDTAEARDELFQAFLAANLANMNSIENADGDLNIDKGLNYIRTDATLTADVKLMLLRGPVQRLSVNASAYESTNELEVALVLDNTGSMGATNMAALRSAATDLVNILENASSSNRKVRAALVPFVAQVNVKGEGYDAGWIDTDGKAPYNGANFDKNGNKNYNHLDLFKHLNVEWKGCVEARPAPYNLDDTAPDPKTPATLFVPSFAPDNPGAAAKSPNSSSAWNNSYLADSFTSSDKSKVKDVARYLSSATARYIEDKPPRSTGPNYACATPITPLTDDFTKLKTSISAMTYWEGGGTNVSEGLAWGMRVLSPGEPYTQGKPFKQESVSKVVVVFTDGENTVFGASSQSFNTSDYGAYSFLDSGRFGTTNRSTALTNVNTWTSSMCTALKNQDVQIFTVLLGADTAANRTLYSACASSPSNYYPTSNVSQLKVAFQKIGNAIAQLSLTQ
ncbi:pilus assembly protein [Mesorhizobium australicum]|uniref:Flp pilus assembly protein TadG n=2 Tax=Mesorhizobium TaxID=68287 RepID=A0A1X7P9Q1_9HYPH|nr:pilus assembly protein [Mesorhizobium australicum]SMH47603.1 Flp pilus assembly protein TadG [Mesorhizobium australicum]